MSDNKLKPCPLCGGDASVQRCYDTNCRNRRCVLYGVNMSHQAWNERPEAWEDASDNTPEYVRAVWMRIHWEHKSRPAVGYFDGADGWYLLDADGKGTMIEHVVDKPKSIQWMEIPG